MANFKDLLLKIAQNRPLTPQELDELGRFGTETQQKNALISGSFQNLETLTVKNLKAVSVEADYVSSLGCRMSTNTTQTIPTGLPATNIQYHVEGYDDDVMINLSVNNDRISINTSGRWLIVADCMWNTALTDMKYLLVAVYSSSDVFIGNVAIDWAPITNNVTAMPFLQKGQYLKFVCRQDSGSNKTLQYSRVALTLMRKTDSGDS